MKRRDAMERCAKPKREGTPQSNSHPGAQFEVTSGRRYAPHQEDGSPPILADEQAQLRSNLTQELAGLERQLAGPECRSAAEVVAKLERWHSRTAYSGRNRAMSPRQPWLLTTALIGFLILPSVPPLTGSSLRLVGAVAQTRADHPAAFTESRTNAPSLRSLTIRQTVYVPAYSSIRLGSGRGKMDLATTLSIHNLSEDAPLIVLRADYFDTAGNLIHSYVPEPIAVRPLGTVEAFVPVEDTRGGSGASFVVEWGAANSVTEPLIEAVLIGLTGTQGYSFVSRGKKMESAQSAR
jgi:hypothetical protein